MFFPEKRFSSRLPAASSRCFRTTADGRIAVNENWSDLLAGLRSLGKVAIQTRHAHARLVAFSELPDAWHETDPCWISAASGELHVNFATWDRAWARLNRCDCCGSPGRIEFCNARDFDFLHVSPRPECTLSAWAGFVGKRVKDELPRKAQARAILPASLCLAQDMPSDEIAVSALPPLLAALGRERIAISCMLGTAEVCHSREFVPLRVTGENALLTAWNDDTSVQLALAQVRSLVLNRRQSSWPLHVMGPDETVLLTLSAGASEREAAGWRSALHDLTRFL